MKTQRKILSLVLALSTLICCFTNLYVKAAELDVSNLTYIVENMTFYKGNEQTNSISELTNVSVDVTEITNADELNYIIIAAYDSYGAYLGMNYSVADFDFSKTKKVNLPIGVANDKTISEVRAFVWDSLSGMTPLSNILSSNSNDTIYFPINWGIAEKFTSLDNEYKLTIFTAEGVKKAYLFDSENGVVKVDGVKEEGNQNEALEALIYASGLTKNDIKDRVIKYKVSSSSNKIIEVDFISAVAGNGDAATDYDAARGKIGAIRLNSSTKIIDAREYLSDETLSANTFDSLSDDASYVAYAYGKSINFAYTFVLIKEGGVRYTTETKMAVVTEDGSTPVFEGIYEIEVLYGSNDVTTLHATDEDEADLLALEAGDVIFFKTNGAGHIKDVDVIFHFDAGIPTYAELATMSLVDDNADNMVDGITITSTGNNFGTGVFTQDWDAPATDKVKFVYGPIAEVTTDYISFAKIYNGETDLYADVQEYDIAPKINVYKYDYGSKARNKFSATTNTTGSTINNPKYVIENNVITWNENSNNTKANFAFALVVEDEVVEIFEFIAK